MLKVAGEALSDAFHVGLDSADDGSNNTSIRSMEQSLVRIAQNRAPYNVFVATYWIRHNYRCSRTH